MSWGLSMFLTGFWIGVFVTSTGVFFLVKWLKKKADEDDEVEGAKVDDRHICYSDGKTICDCHGLCRNK